MASCRASESTDGDSEFNQIRARQIVKKIIYGVKFIWISIGNLDPTIIFVILEWLLLVYWSRSISLVFLRGSPLDRVNHLAVATPLLVDFWIFSDQAQLLDPESAASKEPRSGLVA